jgi:hypothetical protein
MVASSGIEPESGASETLILSIVLRGHNDTVYTIFAISICENTLFCRYKKNQFL